MVAAIMSSVASDAGYVVLPPLAAILFMALGRHPLAGIAAAFAGVSAGFSANLLLSGTDVLLGELTIEAAATIDADYAEGMNLAMNYWFIIAATFLLPGVGTLVSQFVVEPRLGPWKGEGVIEGDKEDLKLTAIEKKGLVGAGVSLLVALAVLALTIVPDSGPLRGDDGGVVQSPFMDPRVVILVVAFFGPGLVYGIVPRTLTNGSAGFERRGRTVESMAVFMVLAFAAGQFIAYFDETKLGLMVSIAGADLLQSIDVTGYRLMVLFLLFVGGVNIF